MSEMHAKSLPELMSQPVVALQVYDTVEQALATAREHGVHHFPVVKHDKVVGMVCTCDFQEVPPGLPIARVMRPAVTLPEQSSSLEAAQLMRAALVGSILVLDFRGRPCGIVTRGDLQNDAPANEILRDCRCECCGAAQHLRGFNGRILCFSCRERANEPAAFDTGGGD